MSPRSVFKKAGDFCSIFKRIEHYRGKLSMSSRVSSIQEVTVIGGGQMGSGIAQVMATKKQKVTVVEKDEASLRRSENNLIKQLNQYSKKLYKNQPEEAEEFLAEAAQQITFSTDLTSSVVNADLIIEAIVEDEYTKKKLFAKLDKVVKKGAILTTNTSSYSVTTFASSSSRPENFAGLHFFNPVPVMNLIEVVRTERTSEATINQLCDWGKGIGKTTVVCKDTPGFIVNRLLFPLVSEAIRMYERGDAEIEDIDNAMKLGANHPIGPIKLSDIVGQDTVASILGAWKKIYPDNELFNTLPSQEKLISEGKLGVKTGHGYYKYK